MMMLVLAWKNIWRNKKRSLIILAATTIGLTAGLFTVGMVSGMYDSIIYTTINRELGNIQIHTPSFQKDQLIEQYIQSPDSLMQILNTSSNIKAASTHSLIEGMASSATTASGVIIYGINPDDEKRITSISKSIFEGSYLDSQQRANSILIGGKLAEKLKLKLRSKLVLSFAGLDGNIIYAAFHISGIYKTYSSTFDGLNVFIRQQDLAPLLNNKIPIHEIVIRTRNSSLLEQTKQELQKKMGPGVKVETWQEIAPEIKLIADSSDIINFILLGIILFALLFGLTNTLLMSVLDRVRDFGVLLAVGMYRRRLFLMIILESLLLSLTGGIIGAILGWAITGYFNTHGIDLSVVSKGLSAYGMPSMLYPYIRPYVYFNLTIMIITMSVIAGLYPAVKAIRLKPVQAISTIG
jgi:ABC-type lipoprotein release transport system permease subunit